MTHLIQEDTQIAQELFEKVHMLLELTMEQEHGQTILLQYSRNQI